MNTERPDNDDADGSVEERGAGGSVEEQGAAETADAPEERDASSTGASGAGEASGVEEEPGTREVADGEDVSGAEESGGPVDEPVAVSKGGEAPDTDETPDGVDGDAGTPGPAEAAASADATPDEQPVTASDATPDEQPLTASDATPDEQPLTAHGAVIRRERDGEEAEHAEETDGMRVARRRSPAVVVSVAAAVLLVGGGGAYFATTAADGSAGSGGRSTTGASGDGTPPPLALEGYADSGGENGVAPGEPDPHGVTYRAAGPLPEGPDSAPVYRTRGEVTKDEVAGLADALGVDGTPVAEGSSWTVGAKDGAGPSLRVNARAPGTWTFHRYAPGAEPCRSETVCARTPADPGGAPVSEAAAKKAAAPVLKAVGQDDTKLDASQAVGAHRIVNAEPVVGELPTYGWTTGVTVGSQGDVVAGNGQLKAPVKGDTYPVLGAEETLARMNASPGARLRAGVGACATSVPLDDQGEAPCEYSAGATTEKEALTVEKAVFGLAPHLVDGRQTLVPSWLFDVRAAGARNDFTVTYPAVDPAFVTSPTPSAGPASPTTGPTAPGDQPTAAPATRNVKVDGYTAEGRELTVSYTGGVCGDYRATVTESGDKVTVTVTETPWKGKVCIAIAKVQYQTVPLDEPLGARTVVGSDGEEIPVEKPGARLPETSGAR
ncbi:hypothetical protein QQS16_13625 [Streptomyces sp. ALI-76-A]|nr:hypothetical protein [Streptomyces sp. ALI-76-A]MDL5201122.1 hypothetical protein [Streptomyces sp. ALI-76-A]